ncbi:hypothetical protein D3C71_1576600 [compost metagenome]
MLAAVHIKVTLVTVPISLDRVIHKKQRIDGLRLSHALVHLPATSEHVIYPRGSLRDTELISRVATVQIHVVIGCRLGLAIKPLEQFQIGEQGEHRAILEQPITVSASTDQHGRDPRQHLARFGPDQRFILVLRMKQSLQGRYFNGQG